MFKYIVKKNDYAIGTVLGKRKAVKILKMSLSWEGITKSEWKNSHGSIIVTTPECVFTIDKDNS